MKIVLKRKFWFIKIIILSVGLLTIFSCKKKEENPPEETPIVQNRVFVVNEGLFQQGNASLIIYDKKNQGLYIDVYQKENGIGLGDIFQSMITKNGKGFFVINNSNKIVVADLIDYHKVGEILSISSPRYILPVSSSKGYVSSLWDHNLAIIDFNSLTITGYIATPGWTEEMVLVNSTAFVTSVKTSAIYLVNTATDLVTDSIVVGQAPKNILADKNGKLWVLCGQYDSPQGKLIRINTQDKTVECSINLPLDQNNVPEKLRINASQDTLYYLYKGVQRMAITDSVPETFLSASHFTIAYGLAVDPDNSEVYVADAVDFTQKGYLLRFSPQGETIDSIKVGYVPSAFYFE
ncbi:MAG: YncE family protein [Bacteroidales bacterium]|nr:YncE family protein [Bacteroidales bacterium]